MTGGEDTEYDVKGPLLHGNRINFGFTRSNMKAVGPITPHGLKGSSQIKFPVFMYRGPNPAKNKIFCQSLYFPEHVCILDIGKWKFIC